MKGKDENKILQIKGGDNISKIYEENDVGIIEIDSHKFGLFKFIIDKDKIDDCKGITWSVMQSHIKAEWGTYYYAMASNNSRIPHQLLHRYLMNCPKGLKVDHKDKNTYNNRLENLRICTTRENACNRKKQTNNTTGYTGVIYDKRSDKYVANVRMNEKYINLGYFDKLEDAVLARKAAVIKYYGDFRADN